MNTIGANQDEELADKRYQAIAYAIRKRRRKFNAIDNGTFVEKDGVFQLDASSVDKTFLVAE